MVVGTCEGSPVDEGGGMRRSRSRTSVPDEVATKEGCSSRRGLPGSRTLASPGRVEHRRADGGEGGGGRRCCCEQSRRGHSCTKVMVEAGGSWRRAHDKGSRATASIVEARSDDGGSAWLRRWQWSPGGVQRLCRGGGGR